MPGVAIDVRDVTVVRQGTTILDGIHWSVPKGGCVAVLGANGSGKTTLMRVVTGYEWVTRGTVDVLGRRLGRTDVRELRTHMSIVNPAERFGVDGALTTLDAALTGYFGSLSLYDQPTNTQRDHAEHLLKTVGLGHRLTHRYHLLSTGEQRRCLLARAMVRIPEILILDEPTAGLDVYAREHLLATIDQLHRSEHPPTIIMVTHHVEEISPTTQQVVLLRGGRVMAMGKLAEVVTPELLSQAMGCKVFVQKRSGRYWLEVLPEAWVELLK